MVDESLGSVFQAQKKNLKLSKAKPGATSALIGTVSANAGKPTIRVKKEDAADEKNEVVVNKSRDIYSSSKTSKEENSADEEDDKPISTRARAVLSDKEASKRKSVDVEKMTKKRRIKDEPITSLPNGRKRERKVYDLPGQKRDPPEEREPLRIFYESLYKQLPNSEMAQIWMMESGLLAKEVAQKIFDKKQKKNPRLTSPMKSVGSSRNGQSTSDRKTVTPAQRSGSKLKEMKAGPSSKQSKKRNNDCGSSGDDSDEESLGKRTLKKQRTAS